MSSEFNSQAYYNPAADWKAKDIGELIITISDRIPELFEKLFRILYSENSAKEMGRAIGGLYKELISAGIPHEAALKMTSDYMISLKNIAQAIHIQNINNQTKEKS